MKNINKYKSLEKIEKDIRLEIMNTIIEKQSVVNIEEIIKILSESKNIEKPYLKEILNKFIENNIMVVDDNRDINFIYPVSAYPTMHKVKLQDGREINAMCAIDALGVGCTFNQDIEINSMCCVTGDKIKINIKDNKIDYINNQDLRVLHIDLEKYENWAASC